MIHPGEDIRAAKALFEDAFGEQNWTDVNLWLEFAKEVCEYLNVKTYQEAVEKLDITVKRLGQ